MLVTLRKLIKDEGGATAIEYGLIAALVAVGIIVILGTMRDSLIGVFEEVSGELDGAVGGGG
jgi:pilus assembly protein Flp/PilA